MASEFGSYIADERIADGETASLWRAHHRDLGRTVAIKVLNSRLASDPEAMALLRSEAHRLTELAHPHIVAVYDYVEQDGPPYLVTEWVDGETLEQLMRRVGTLTPQQSLAVMRGALLGLAHAHEQSVVHGDVSPSNMMLDETGTTRLIDFGLAVPTGEPGVSGTPAYISPEAAAGAPLVPASDVYSAAAVLYQLLTGSPVFAADSALAVIRAHREERAPAVDGYGPQFGQLLARALEKDPAARPADAGEFLSELEEAAESRYGAGWLAAGSVAGLVGTGAAGAAATAAATSGGTTAAAAAATAGGDAVATAAADTGAASGSATGVVKNAGRMRRVITSHPVIAGATAVVVVAAATTGVVLASGGGKERPKPPPEAILLASSPQGGFTVSGAIMQTSDPGMKVTRLKPYKWKVTEKCGPTSCKATVAQPGSTYVFTYSGDSFTSTTTNAHRVTCVDKKTQKEVPGSTAVLHHTVTWTLHVTKRAPATPDGPGRALELSGTAVERNSYSDFTMNCEDIGATVTRYSFTVRQA